MNRLLMGGGVVLASLVFAAATPEPGQYKIVRDTAQSQKKLWGLFCGKADEKAASTVGKKLNLTVKGEEWKAVGGGRKFGTATCEGMTNPTLKPVDRSVQGGWITFRCRSTRVTRGTETTSHRVRLHDDGSVEFRTTG